MGYKQSYLEKRRDDSKILTIRTALDKLGEYERKLQKTCCEFTIDDFKSFFSDNKWVYPRTFSMYRSIIVDYMKYLNESGMPCNPAPLAQVKLKQLDRSIRYNDMFTSFCEMDDKISSVFFTGDYDAQREGVAILLYAVGLSKEEIADIQYRQIDFDHQIIQIGDRTFRDVEPFILDHLRAGCEATEEHVVKPSGHRNLYKGRTMYFSKRLLSLAKERWHDAGYQDDRIIPTNMRRSYTFIKMKEHERKTGLDLRNNVWNAKSSIFRWTALHVSSEETMRLLMNDYSAWKTESDKW